MDSFRQASLYNYLDNPKKPSFYQNIIHNLDVNNTLDDVSPSILSRQEDFDNSSSSSSPPKYDKNSSRTLPKHNIYPPIPCYTTYFCKAQYESPTPSTLKYNFNV